MTYRHTIHLHGDYLDGDLSPDQKDQIKRHLDTCAECRQDLEKLRRLTQALHAIEGPDPGDAYFENLTDLVMARTATMTGPAVSSRTIPEYRGPGRQTLTTLIKLAAAVTLLFTAFYISDFNYKNYAPRWAEYINHGGYAAAGESGPNEYMMPLSVGINTLLSSPQETEPEKTTSQEESAKE